MLGSAAWNHGPRSADRIGWPGFLIGKSHPVNRTAHRATKRLACVSAWKHDSASEPVWRNQRETNRANDRGEVHVPRLSAPSRRGHAARALHVTTGPG